MKKFIIALFLALASIIGLVGCGGGSQNSTDVSSSTQQSSVIESSEIDSSVTESSATESSATESSVIESSATESSEIESSEIESSNSQSEHVHNFVVYETKKAYCAKDGYKKLKCECGEKTEEVIPMLGHDIQYYSTTPATCTKPGQIKHKCTRCSKEEIEKTEPLGHEMSEFIEASRITYCTRRGCVYTQLAEGNGKYAETLAFTFDDDDKALLEAKHNELASILEEAEKYDPTLHGLTSEGPLFEAYNTAEALYEEYSDLLFEAQGQYSIAMTLYYCEHTNKDLEQRYNDMQTYYTDLVAKFYSLSQPWYDSMFREFFFEGATEEEINAFLFDSNAYANEEYTTLKNRNDEIELEFNGISNPAAGNKTPELYAEFVANNTRMAEILGYENYLEYAYENIYDRDYTYQDAAQFVEYVKDYIVPVYNSVYGKWNKLTSGNLNEADIETYYSVVSNSFFKDAFGNKLFNDYIDDMNMAFTSNPDKQISFSDTLNNLMADGNMFRGSYEGAYVTYIRGVNLPIAYFGKKYDSAMTVAHEFGHYMNEIYNDDAYNQSFDLLETHSQGQEMLFMSYARDFLEGDALQLVETYQLLSTLQTIILSTQVDCFEQAIYLNYYDGPGSEEIMADGMITADEYDTVYAGLSEYLGINESYRVDEYWRYVTISSPCYYISYAVSGVNALQIYVDAINEGFDAAKESYLKLFTYTDVDPEMTTEEILLYADLTSYVDEQTFIRLKSTLSKIIK